MKLTHIAFIVDGNSTWAKENKVSRIDGYKAGMDAVANTIMAASRIGIKFVTFYVFSSENWLRSAEWVKEFMGLAKKFFKTDEKIQRILTGGTRLKIIGDIAKLDREFQAILIDHVAKTASNKGIIVQLAVSYGGRDEIARTARKIAELGLDFTEETFSQNLDTAGIPDPQLIVRTGRKQRLSNFLLWQASYSELYFPNILWPDFDETQLQMAIEEFHKRERTYGK
jgi:undecaprenyl diphosphate synthase